MAVSWIWCLHRGFAEFIGTHRNVEVCGILLHAGRCFDPSGFSLWLKALGICRCSISHQREPILFHKHNNNRIKSRSREITFRVTEWENHCVSHKHPRSPTLLDIQTPNSFLYSAGWIFQQQKYKVNFAEDEYNLSSFWAINDFFLFADVLGDAGKGAELLIYNNKVQMLVQQNPHYHWTTWVTSNMYG